MTLAASLLLALVVLAGLLLARRAASYAPMARALLALGVLHAARVAATWPARGERPYAGVARWLWSAEQAAGWGFYGVAAVAVWGALASQKSATPGGLPEGRLRPGGHFGSGRTRTARAIILATLALTASAYLAYPAMRGPATLRLLTAIAWASAAVQIHAAFRFVTRQPRPPLTPGALTAATLAVSAVLSAAGPYLFARPDRDWTLAPWIAVATWAIVLTLQLHALVAPTPGAPQ